MRLRSGQLRQGEMLSRKVTDETMSCAQILIFGAEFYRLEVGFSIVSSKAIDSFATKAALHQLERSPVGLVIGLTVPPGVALGSPVKTKQFSRLKLVS